MKFGTLYSYWGTKWQCDYLKTLKRVSDIGFDILEMGAPHLLEMSDYELSELRRAAKDMDMVLTANIGPAKDKDLASPAPDIRKAGVNYLIDILKAMEKVGSKSLVGAMYSYWPCQFEITDKEAAWERSIEGMKEVAEAAESLGIECCQEVLNRYETYIITDCREGLEYCRRVGISKKIIFRRLSGLQEENWAICMWENQTESFREWDPFLGEISDGR